MRKTVTLTMDKLAHAVNGCRIQNLYHAVGFDGGEAVQLFPRPPLQKVEGIGLNNTDTVLGSVYSPYRDRVYLVVRDMVTPENPKLWLGYIEMSATSPKVKRYSDFLTWAKGYPEPTQSELATAIKDLASVPMTVQLITKDNDQYLDGRNLVVVGLPGVGATGRPSQFKWEILGLNEDEVELPPPEYDTSKIANPESEHDPVPQSLTTYYNRLVMAAKNRVYFYYWDVAAVSMTSALQFYNLGYKSDRTTWVETSGSTLVVFGERSIEFWGNTDNEESPFASDIGRSVADIGLLLGTCKKIGGAIYFVGIDQAGNYGVYRISGNQIEKISTPEMEATEELKNYDTCGQLSIGANNFFLIHRNEEKDRFLERAQDRYSLAWCVETEKWCYLNKREYFRDGPHAVPLDCMDSYVGKRFGAIVVGKSGIYKYGNLGDGETPYGDRVEMSVALPTLDNGGQPFSLRRFKCDWHGKANASLFNEKWATPLRVAPDRENGVQWWEMGLQRGNKLRVAFTGALEKLTRMSIDMDARSV